MADSIIEQAREFFDSLVKSRFNELFGNIISNSKNLKMAPIFELCDMKAGKAINAKDLMETPSVDTYPCFGGNGIRGYITKYSHVGTYPIVGRQGALCGNVNLASGKFYATEHAVVVSPKVDLDPIWLYYVLTELRLNRFATASAQPGLSVGKVEKTLMPVVDIEVQKEFGEFVKQVDKSRIIFEQQVVQYDELIKSRFNELFGDCKEKIEIGKVCSLHSRIGWQALTKAEHMDSGEYMLVTGTDFVDGRVNWSGCKFVTKERYEMDPNIIIQNGDILVTKDGTIGKVAIVENIPGPATLNAGVFVVRNTDNNFLTEYLQQCLLSVDFQRFIESVKRGATIVHLNQGKFVKFTIPVADLDLQQEFVDFVKQVDKSRFLLLSHLKNLAVN